MVERNSNSRKVSTNTLRAWLRENKSNPYPTKGEKIMLAVLSDMSLTQISTWFANARRRLKKENLPDINNPNGCLIGSVCGKKCDAQRKHTASDVRLTKQTESTGKQFCYLPANEVCNNLPSTYNSVSDQLCKSVPFSKVFRSQNKAVSLLRHECTSTKSCDCLVDEFHTKSAGTDGSNISNSSVQSRFGLTHERNPAHSQTTKPGMLTPFNPLAYKDLVLNSTCLNETSSQTDRYKHAQKELTSLQPFTLTEQLKGVTSMFTFNMFQ
ncbi:uncharacterized protein DEA37_0009877 [Paragonimus westermani]|uniref:Homeobox domain-containing protein n=1 Tax=Paragonimus westermani TaxID=34504 RepID=A0A5J4NU39_9TREM|nr:uncharacterized protein DEA37_0009877 [Paragonimus westermani]